MDMDLKQLVRDLDREGPKNLYTRVKKVRDTRKERDANLNSHLHPDLHGHEAVTMEKFAPKNYKRGL